jgi:hypothetical protein
MLCLGRLCRDTDVQVKVIADEGITVVVYFCIEGNGMSDPLDREVAIDIIPGI